MRIEVDDQIVEELERIKDIHNIPGKGLAVVISFLIKHYKQTTSIEKILYNHSRRVEKLINEFKEENKETIEKVVKELLRRVMAPLIQ